MTEHVSIMMTTRRSLHALAPATSGHRNPPLILSHPARRRARTHPATSLLHCTMRPRARTRSSLLILLGLLVGLGFQDAAEACVRVVVLRRQRRIPRALATPFLPLPRILTACHRKTCPAGTRARRRSRGGARRIRTNPFASVPTKLDDSLPDPPRLCQPLGWSAGKRVACTGTCCTDCAAGKFQVRARPHARLGTRTLSWKQNGR